MKVGFYGDDFTGAVDSLLQYRRAGLTGVLATTLEDARNLEGSGGSGDHDVVGVAGIARSLPTTALEAEVRPVLEWLAWCRAPIIQYKASSTADSSPERGSLGRICEIAQDVLGPDLVPAVFAQPSFGRYTFFGHHFAAEGGNVFRLDRQPTMREHPSTPITESDLSLHIGRQTHLPVTTLPWTCMEDPRADLAELVNPDVGDTGPGGIVVCDAVNEEHLERLGKAIAGRDAGRSRFVLGSGGLSFGIGRALGGTAASLVKSVRAASGPCLVLSGSLSVLSWTQIRAAGDAGWRVVDMRDPGGPDEAVRLHGLGYNTILHTTAPGGVSLSPTEVVDGLIAAGRSCLERAPETRLVLFGGDTSGAILRGLGISGLALEAAPWGNVVLCSGIRRDGGRPLEIVLKGGQMGYPSLLEDIRRGAWQATEDVSADTTNRATANRVSERRPAPPADQTEIVNAYEEDPMSRLAVIHTGAVVIPEISRLATEHMPGTEIQHLLDDKIVGDLGAGAATTDIHDRLKHLAEAAKRAGASSVMFSCSSISGYAAGLQNELGIPVLRIDEAMADQAVATGTRITVLASLPTTLIPTIALLKERAELANRRVVLTDLIVEGAFEAVANGNRDIHDALIAAAIVEQAQHADVVVLAQASMASAAAIVKVDVPVLTSPELGIRRVAQLFAN